MIADLSGKAAIVTGGARGIGRGICLALAEQGADVAVADTIMAGAESAAREVASKGRCSLALEADVTSRESVAGMVSRALEGFGKIDALVNNAGIIGAPGWWERQDINDDDWQMTYDVNVRGAVNATEAVAGHMRERRYGKIVNIASVAARRGMANMGHYNASKAAIVSYTQSSAHELAPHNINVNAVCPGLLWTPMWEKISQRRPAGEDDELLRGLKGREYFDRVVSAKVPLQREQTPEDIGNATVFFVSDGAGNITGQALNVDGGIFMN